MYEYLTGLIRVLEKRLPDKTDIDRMTLAKSAKEAFDVLNDTDYADNLLNRKPEDYNQVLEDDMRQLKNLLTNSIGKSRLFDFLFVDFDFLNIKTALKKKLLDIAEEHSFSSFGLTTDKTMSEFIDLKFQFLEHKDKKAKASEIALATGKIKTALLQHSDKIKKYQINPMLKTSIIKIIRKIKKIKNISPSKIDELCDQELLKLKQIIAKQIKNSFVTDFLKMQIDFLNTKILLRTYRIKLKTPFIKGGLIDKNRLMHLYKADEQVLYVNLAELFELYGISHVIDEFKEKKDLWRLEKELDRRAFNFVHTASKSACSGPEVIVSYFLNKMIGARNVRTILSGKLNGVGMEEIRERVII